MTVRNYVNTLVEMLKKNPEIEHMEVVYSTDDEGNSFQKVNFLPCVMLSQGLENNYIVMESKTLKSPTEGDVLCIN